MFGGIGAQRIDEPIAKVVAQVHDLAIGYGAVRLGEPDVSFRVQTFRFLIIDHAVGFESGGAVIELHVAYGRNALVGVVVIDLLRTNEHLLLTGAGCRSGDRFLAWRKCQKLGKRGRCNQAAGKACEAEKGHERPAPHASAPARTEAGGRHHPSSW